MANRNDILDAIDTAEGDYDWDEKGSSLSEPVICIRPSGGDELLARVDTADGEFLVTPAGESGHEGLFANLEYLGLTPKFEQ